MDCFGALAGCSGSSRADGFALRPCHAGTLPRTDKSHKTQKPVALPPLPSGPLSQLPMDQIPPTPAKVSYQGGLLTISAQNSTLGEILRDVRRLTGASIEIPQNAKRASRHSPRPGSATGCSGRITQWFRVQLRDGGFELGSDGGFERDPYGKALAVGRGRGPDADCRECVSE